MGKIKIGILTNFAGCDQSFSLVVVVKTQLRMLLDAGYLPILFVASEFVEGEGVFSSKTVEIRKVAPHMAESKDILKALKSLSKDIDIFFCHDLVFLSHYREWGDAIREFAKKSSIKFIHWQHSRGDEIREGCANSWYAYPNSGDLEYVARCNSTKLENVRYIPHPLDFDYLGWPELALRIAEDTRLPFVDVGAILPTRLDRQKQVERAVRVMAGIKKAGKSICMIVADAYATGPRFKEYKKDILEIAKEQHVLNDLHLLGEEYAECEISTPRQVVKALYEMSNLFILPSNAETSSLVALEASLAGNLLVLNEDFPPIHRLYKGALTLPFGSVLATDRKYFRTIKTTDGEQQIEDPQLFFDDKARETVVPALESQMSIKVKRQQLRERWPSVVLKDYVEPLINEICVRPKYDWTAIWHNCGDRIGASQAALKAFPNGRVAYGCYENYGVMICQGRCTLNLPRADIVNMRVYEAMACGVPLVTKRIPDLARFGFEEDRHYLGFDDIDEMLDKISWVNTHLGTAQTIADNARQFVLDNHTYSHRAKEILMI